MKTVPVFKLNREPDGFNQVFSESCEIKIAHKEGNIYLNYEERPDRVVGKYSNLRLESEMVLADIDLLDKYKTIEHRFDYSIGASVISKNSEDEATSILITAIGALMPNKF